jgi:hypothetical protein
MPRIATPPPRQRQEREVESDHKAFIARFGCLICGAWPVEVAHIRYASALFGKPEAGMQAKPDDLWTLPLCPGHHRLGKDAQHSGGERDWWRCQFDRYDREYRDPLTLCLLLYYRCSPDEDKARRLLDEWRVA